MFVKRYTSKIFNVLSWHFFESWCCVSFKTLRSPAPNASLYVGEFLSRGLRLIWDFLSVLCQASARGNLQKALVSQVAYVRICAVRCGGGALKLSNRQVFMLDCYSKFWGIVLSAASLHFSQWSAMRRHKPLQSTAMLPELTFALLLRLKVYGFAQAAAKWSLSQGMQELDVIQTAYDQSQPLSHICSILKHTRMLG